MDFSLKDRAIEKVCRVIKRVLGVLEDVVVVLHWVPGVLRATKGHLGALRKVQEFSKLPQKVCRVNDTFPSVLTEVRNVN